MPEGYLQSPRISVKHVENRGRGGRTVIAVQNIKKGTIIEWLPCILIPDTHLKKGSTLNHYVFRWIKKVNGKKTCALALGYGSLYNHSYNPNAYYTMEDEDCMMIVARRHILKGQEITINYNGDPNDQTDVGFEVNDGNNINKLQKAKKRR